MSSLLKRIQAQAPQATDERAFDVPKTFLGFLEWVGVTPSAGQAELARVAYDGAEPVDRALAERIFGAIDFARLPVGLRRVFVAVVGARGGKSYLLIALRLVWGMLVRDLSVLAPGELAYATVVAPNDRHRQHVINFALGVMRSRPELRRLLRLPQGSKPDAPVSAFDVCHVGVVLRAVLFVHGLLAVGVLFAAASWSDALTLFALGAGSVLPAVLAWLLILCAGKAMLGALPPPAQWVVATGLGALCGAAGSVLAAASVATPPASCSLAATANQVTS